MPDKVQFLCSCSDYLNGTSGKLTKKKTNCKQCKGIKLPFAPIGGTLRMFSTPYVFDPAVTRRRNCVGTVRLPSSTSATTTTAAAAFATAHRRPTILCGDHDPYDFLRQSRLLYSGNDQRTSMPEASNETSRLFRNAASGPTSANNAIVRSHRNFMPNATVGRASAQNMLGAMIGSSTNRSILQTNINPYDLISSTLNNNEFSPSSTNLYDLVTPRKLNSNQQQISVAIDLPTTARKMPAIAASMAANSRTPSTVSSRTSSRATTANSSSDSSNSATLASPSKYKSILKQPLLAANASRTIADSPIVLREFDNKLFEQRPLSMPASNELRNSQLNRIPVPVRSVSISNGGATPSTVPMSTYDVQAVGRNKKVQFSESSKKNEKSCDADGDAIERNSRAKSPPAQSTAGADTRPKATIEGLFISFFVVVVFNFLNSHDFRAAEFTRSRRRKSINRSLSDRRIPDLKEDIKFKDTTALRAKPIRLSPQQLFQKHLSPTRPSSPPPKLPTTAPSKAKQPPPIPVRPPRQQRK